jgi:hypothetical protein
MVSRTRVYSVRPAEALASYQEMTISRLDMEPLNATPTPTSLFARRTEA